MFIGFIMAFPEHLEGRELEVVASKILAVRDTTVHEDHPDRDKPRVQLFVEGRQDPYYVWGTCEIVIADIEVSL